MATRPGCPALRPDPGAAGLIQPEPQVAAVFRGGVAAQQGRVGEPLLEQPDRPAGQVQALGSGPALHIGQQDDGVPGPVDVADHQVVDAVRDDAGVDAEQQPVGDHRVQAREQVAAGVQDTAALADHVVRAAQVLTERDDADGARPGQQPAQVIPAPAVLTGMAAPAGRGRGLLVRGERLAGDRLAGAGQAGPLGLGIRRQLMMVALGVEGPAGRELGHSGVQGAACGLEPEQHPAGACLLRAGGGHPVAGRLRSPQAGRVPGEPGGGQAAGHVPHGRRVVLHRAGRVDRAVRVDQLGQARQQVFRQLRAGQPVQGEPRGRAVAEHARDPQRLPDDLGRHQASPPSLANSVSASHSAAWPSISPLPAPACSYASR